MGAGKQPAFGTKLTQRCQLNRGKTMFLICVRLFHRHNKTPRAGWLSTATIYLSLSWRLSPRSRSWSVALVSPEASLLCFTLTVPSQLLSLPSSLPTPQCFSSKSRVILD